MEIKLENRTYTVKIVKARMFRKAIEISTEIDFNNLKTIDLDKLIDFIVELYENQFTRDDLYDNLPANELMSTLSGSVSQIVNGVGDKIESKNE